MELALDATTVESRWENLAGRMASLSAAKGKCTASMIGTTLISSSNAGLHLTARYPVATRLSDQIAKRRLLVARHGHDPRYLPKVEMTMIATTAASLQA